MPAKQDGHARKKHIQQSIAPYLRRVSPHVKPSEHSQSLSEETQSMLIHVGMRVRKSVPEGYKTHRTIKQASQPCSLHNTCSTSSESSDISYDSSFSDSSKRAYEEEEEEVMDAISAEQEAQLETRPMAKARSRAQRDHDFGEASFLASPEKMDLG